MRNNLLIIIASVFILFLCMSTQCNKEYTPPTYTFIEKLNLFPAQKVYHTGDTIWLQYNNVGKKLFDYKSGLEIPVDSISIPFMIGFNGRYNHPVSPADGFCDFVSSNGINVGRYLGDFGSSDFQNFGCNTNNNFDFIVGVVLKKTGIYSLDLFGAPRYLSSCSNRVSNYINGTLEYFFNVQDCNKDIYLTIPGASGNMKNKIDSKKAFVVKVE